LTVGHELNVTGASITGFNAVKISVDTITAPDEIVNIYGGLNYWGGYEIYGRTENQNVTFSRHNTSGDLIGLQLTSTGTNLTYYDSVAATTTTFSLNKNVAKLNSDTIATQSYVRSNGGTGSAIDTTSMLSTKQNVLNQIWGYARDSSKIGFIDYNRTVSGRWTYSDLLTLNDSVSMFGQGLFVPKNGNGIRFNKSLTATDTVYSSVINTTGRILGGAEVIANSFTSVSGGGYKATAGGIFYFDTRTVIKSPFDGGLVLSNNAETSFDRIMLGGTTSSFPSLKRFGTGLKLMLADTSALTDLTLKNLNSDTVITRWLKGTNVGVRATGDYYLDVDGVAFMAVDSTLSVISETLTLEATGFGMSFDAMGSFSFNGQAGMDVNLVDAPTFSVSGNPFYLVSPFGSISSPDTTPVTMSKVTMTVNGVTHTFYVENE